MSQHDYNIANQSFPSFRTDLNNALSAIQTCNSGTSRPTGAVAGQIWLDTTSATSPTLKYYDGADDISLATIDHSANTVNWLDSTVSVTGLSTTATGTVLTLTDTVTTSSVNLIIDNQKEIRFNETTANGTNYVALKAPASLTTDTTFVLPSADGTAGQFLKTDGAGNLSFDSLSFSTPLAVIGNATAGSEIRLPEDTDNGSNYVAIKAPDTLASNLTLTLPSADGSSGQVLQTNGSGVLSFSSPSAGSYVFLGATGSQSAQSTIDLNGFFTSDYNYYHIFIDGLFASSNNTEIRMRVWTANGVETSTYYSNIYERITDGTDNSSNISNSNGFEIARAMSSSASGGSSINFITYNPLGTTGRKTYTGSAIVGSDSANARNCFIGGFWNTTTAITGFRWFPNAGTMTVNNIRIYGVKNS